MMITLQHVRQALALPDFDVIQAHLRMAPNPSGVGTPPHSTPAREAGVLALLFPHQGDGGRLHVVLTRRTETLRGHSGQVSFPGGRRDPEDRSFEETALRETCEELGICDGIEIIGSLTQTYIPPSHFNVHPYVGYLPTMPKFRPCEAEVAAVFTVSLETLLSDEVKCQEYRTFGRTRALIPYYDLCGHQVWGATAIMLSELEQRLHAVV